MYHEPSDLSEYDLPEHRRVQFSEPQRFYRPTLVGYTVFVAIASLALVAAASFGFWFGLVGAIFR